MPTMNRIDEIRERCEKATPEEITQMNDFINSQCANLLDKNTALQAEVDRLREEKSMHRVSVNAGASAIKQLKAENERLRAERDAAKKDLQIMADGVPCDVCMYRESTPCTELLNGKCFKWRGSEA